MKTLAEIKADSFRPDVTRSGQLSKADDAASESSVSSGTPCSSSSDDPEASVCKAEEPMMEELLRQDQIIRNDSSRRLHIMSPDGRLTCGREPPVKYTILDSIPDKAKFCGGCF